MTECLKTLFQQYLLMRRMVFEMKQNNKINQSTAHVMGNSWWILKFVFKYAPTLVCDKVIRIPIAVAAAYIEINLTRWILDSVEQGAYSVAIKVIIIIF